MRDEFAGDRRLQLDAIADRLRRGVAASADATPAMHAIALECAQALECLSPDPSQQVEHIRRLERDLRQAQARLAVERPEMPKSRVGEFHQRRLAQYDCIAALPDRSQFHARLDEALRPVHNIAPALAILLLEFDGLKALYDRHGQDTGTTLLSIVSQRMSRAVRSEDVIYRLENHRLACLFFGSMGSDQLSKVACKLFDAASAPLQVGSMRFNLLPSIGLATCPADGDTGVGLLSRVDAALRRAKEHEKGFSFFD